MQERLRRLQSAFNARGADPVTAAQQAQGALWGTVQRQASILTFNRTFLLFGLIMAVLVPLGFVMRRPRSGRQTAASE